MLSARDSPSCSDAPLIASGMAGPVGLVVGSLWMARPGQAGGLRMGSRGALVR